MGSYAVADEVQGVFGRAGVEDGACRAVGVQGVAEVDALNVFFFNVPGTEETDFFLHRENDCNLSVGDIGFLHEVETFQDSGDAGFVIAA